MVFTVGLEAREVVVLPLNHKQNNADQVRKDHMQMPESILNNQGAFPAFVVLVLGLI